MQDATSLLLWWVLSICDPKLYIPGPNEAAARGSKKFWPRDRHSELPWGVLEGLLREVVALRGDRQRYMQEVVPQDRWLVNVGAERVLSRGTICPPIADVPPRSSRKQI